MVGKRSHRGHGRASGGAKPDGSLAARAASAAGAGADRGRGYLRARAIGVVREETSRLIEQEGSALAANRGQIEEAALQLLISMISSQLGQSRPQAVRRRAA